MGQPQGVGNVRDAAYRRAAEPGVLEGLQVAGDPLAGDVAPHPEPVNERPRRGGRICERVVDVISVQRGNETGQEQEHAEQGATGMF